MKNLAGVEEADRTIMEELYLADIEIINTETPDFGEVPYTKYGRIGYWKFERAWRYWVATVEDRIQGLPLKAALELHYKPNPVNPDQTLGQVIRSGGDAGASSPDEYGAQPILNKELDKKLLELGHELKTIEIGDVKHEYVAATVGDISEHCNAGRLDVERYVTSYHIDSQVGLLEFAKFVKKFYFSKK